MSCIDENVGQRVDFDVSANVIISRPNKLRAERKGDLEGTYNACFEEAGQKNCTCKP